MTPYDTFHDLLTQRFSCRAFLPEPIPDAIITKIIEAARHVPSWCNAQPWQIEITKGAATENFRTQMLATAQDGTTPAPDLAWPDSYSDAYAERRRTTGFQLYEAVGIERSDHEARTAQRLRNFALFDAPHVAIVHSPTELGPYGAMDCGGFVAAFTLAATAVGVATIPQAAIAAFAPAVHACLGIGNDRQVLCAISFGRADMDHPANQFRTARAAPDDLIGWHG